MALVVHAVIFGSLHAYQGLPGMIGTGVVALIFGVSGGPSQPNLSFLKSKMVPDIWAEQMTYRLQGAVALPTEPIRRI